jgi:hypothetical protein
LRLSPFYITNLIKIIFCKQYAYRSSINNQINSFGLNQMEKYFSVLFITVILFLTGSPLLAQTESTGLTWPQGLGFANRLEYSYNVESEKEILENWLNLDYSFGMFSAGLRLEVFQPNDPDPSISRGKENYA